MDDSLYEKIVQFIEGNIYPEATRGSAKSTFFGFFVPRNTTVVVVTHTIHGICSIVPQNMIP